MSFQEITVVMIKASPGRHLTAFTSLHYFLTTRGRVSVLGPLPAAFKDFYLVALGENEPLPDSLQSLEGIRKWKSVLKTAALVSFCSS